jgi:hypothetical protein
LERSVFRRVSEYTTGTSDFITELIGIPGYWRRRIVFDTIDNDVLHIGDMLFFNKLSDL